MLIISPNVGRTAPGIVFEKLIEGLSKIHSVDLITSDFHSSNLRTANKITIVPKLNLHPRLFKLFISIFGVCPTDRIWERKVLYRLGKCDIKKYDLIFSFVSFHHYTALFLGEKLRRYGPKWAVYSVDAIPAPIGWSKNDAYYRSVKRIVSKKLSKAQYYFAANEEMLMYQLTTFDSEKLVYKGVVFNPNGGRLIELKTPYSFESYTFLYTGGIYGVRNPKYLLQAFRKLLKQYPNSTLEFVGTSLDNSLFKDFSDFERRKIMLHPFTRDLIPYYERATALLDIDSELEDDVFLSSKMVNYLTINRLIISETGNNSPSRKLFSGIASIIQCNHDSDMIAKAMKKAIEDGPSADFRDREEIISKFGIDRIVTELTQRVS